MTDQNITYRGATTTVEALKKEHQAHEAARAVPHDIQYRGNHAETAFFPHRKKTRQVSYRGARAEMEV